MDERVFICYLNYQKSNNPDISKKLKVLPLDIWVLMIAVVISICGAIGSVCKGWDYASYIFLFCEVVLSILFYWRFENYRIKISKISLEKHREYCLNIEDWLKTIKIEKYEHIELVYKRITERIVKNENEHKNSSDRLDKWVQVLAVPVLLCFITEIIKSDADLVVAVANLFVVIFISIIGFSSVYIFRFLKWFPIKREIAQMQYFAEDLRSILDYRELENKELLNLSKS